MNQPPSRRRKKATPAASDGSTLPNDLVQEDISGQENPATATITVTAVEVPELTEQEISDRLHLERKVERAFFEAGKALAELRDRKLYRSTHKTFEEYCKQRFGYTRIAASYKIAAATVMDNLLTNGLQKEEIATDELQTPKMLTNGLQILPNNERQVRPLVSLEPEVQREAWQKAVEEAGGKVPSGRIVCEECGAAHNGANQSTQYLPVGGSVPNPCKRQPRTQRKRWVLGNCQRSK